MIATKIKAFGLALAACSALLSCTNAEEGSPVVDALKALPETLSNKKKAPTPVSPALIAEGLASTDRPVMIYVIEKNKGQFLALQVGRNGSHQTFANLGLQSVSQNRGMVTSTRGLGGDLMSSEEDALLSLVRSKSAGRATYVMRFLTTDNQTETHSFDCITEPSGTHVVALGEVNSTGTAVNAHCRGDYYTFTNVFIVDRNGIILSSRQWLGDTIQYFSAQALRL